MGQDTRKLKSIKMKKIFIVIIFCNFIFSHSFNQEWITKKKFVAPYLKRYHSDFNKKISSSYFYILSMPKSDDLSIGEGGTLILKIIKNTNIINKDDFLILDREQFEKGFIKGIHELINSLSEKQREKAYFLIFKTSFINLFKFILLKKEYFKYPEVYKQLKKDLSNWDKKKYDYDDCNKMFLKYKKKFIKNLKPHVKNNSVPVGFSIHKGKILLE